MTNWGLGLAAGQRRAGAAARVTVPNCKGEGVCGATLPPLVQAVQCRGRDGAPADRQPPARCTSPSPAQRRAIPERERRGTRLVFRQGSPLVPADLQLVAASRAGATIIMSDQSRRVWRGGRVRRLVRCGCLASALGWGCQDAAYSGEQRGGGRVRSGLQVRGR